ncbi:MAG TPA: glycosyltransferase family 2 protein [Phycisphaerales bacterium]|nr:glycosyltransferase family 2 protein [Phycisphaerales bacterium]
MMKTPRFLLKKKKDSVMQTISVIMPVYNAERYLPETLESFRSNLLPGVELIAVNDGCTDRSMELIREAVPEARILTQNSGGPSKARNLGLQQSESEYVAFLDSDDLWPEDTLSRMLSILRGSGGAIVQGKIETFADGEVAENLKHRMRSAPFYGVNLGSFLIKREVVEKLNGFDESLRFGEDTDFWIRCWEEGLDKSTISEVTLKYRLHSHNMSVEAASDAKMLLPLLKRHRDRMAGRKPQSSTSLSSYLGWRESQNKERT